MFMTISSIGVFKKTHIYHSEQQRMCSGEAGSIIRFRIEVRDSALEHPLYDKPFTGTYEQALMHGTQLSNRFTVSLDPTQPQGLYFKSGIMTSVIPVSK